ncbi:hypothetical protein TorRG33x02_026730, partial [Trema orientale]
STVRVTVSLSICRCISGGNFATIEVIVGLCYSLSISKEVDEILSLDELLLKENAADLQAVRFWVA